MQDLHDSLETGGNEVHVDIELGKQAMIPLQRMLDFAGRNSLTVSRPRPLSR